MSCVMSPQPVTCPDSFAARYRAYRARHGRQSLLLYAGRGGHFVCKHADAECAILVELGTHAEVTLTPDEFKAEFTQFVDDVLFFLGTEAQQAAAEAQLDAQMAATRLCMEQEHQGHQAAAR